MKETLAAETVILKDDVRLPEGVKVETEPYTPGWKVLKNMDAYGLDRAIRAAGWTFFSLAHALKVGAIGGKKSNRIERGIKKLAARMRTGEFNALEITESRAKSFLGVPYVSITGRSRHIQQSMFLVPEKDVQASSKKLGAHPTAPPAFLYTKRAGGEITDAVSI